MQRDQTDAKLGHTNHYPKIRPAAHPVVAMPAPARPLHATANLRATLGTIAGLLLIWFVIVTV